MYDIQGLLFNVAIRSIGTEDALPHLIEEAR